MKKRKSNISQEWTEEEVLPSANSDKSCFDSNNSFKKKKTLLDNEKKCSSVNKINKDKDTIQEIEDKVKNQERVLNGEFKEKTKSNEKKKHDEWNHKNDEDDDTDVDKIKNDLDSNTTENKSKEDPKQLKKRKKGLIYVSNLPKHMNVTLIREYLGQYGNIGRVYLQPDKTSMCRSKKRKNMARHFSEGWVEFLSKRVAKEVASKLNNTQIGTRKKSKFYDSLWCIKYLPSFKWVHLSERLAYEQAVYKKRLMVEISQARKETDFFQQNLDKSEIVKNEEKKQKKKSKK